MYEYLLNILIESEADISICNFKYVYEKEDSQNNLNKKSNIEVLEKIDALRKNISDEIKSYAWNKLYKINLFKDIRYPVGRKMEDCGTTYKLFDLSNKITIGNEIKYYYLQRENSILNRRNFELYKDYYELTLERYRHIKKKYPYMIENDIDMVNRILNIYIKDSKDMKLYIKNHNTEIISIFNEITNNKNFKKSIKNKMKMKIILFKINKKLFIVMSKIKINRKGKK